MFKRKKLVLVDVNYIYFGTFLGVLILTSLSSIFAKENLSGSLFFFSLYAIGQALLETAILLFLGWLIRLSLGRLCFMLYIGLTFVLAIFHIFDFLMERILDLSIWETLDFVFDESLDNFLLLLDASGVPLWAWAIFFILLAAMPLIGMGIYRATHFFSDRSRLCVRRESFLLLFVCIPAALLLWDFSGSGVLHPDAYTGFIKSLPWKITFFRPKSTQIDLSSPIRSPLGAKEMEEAFLLHPLPRINLPNIYLFVVESFRADCINLENAPHLSAFKEQSFHFDHALSNANGTHISWYSLFHSQYPFHWNQRNILGSPPLRLLKKWGYQIHVYSSAQLGYYGMDELLFGKEGELLTSFQKFHHKGALKACETDAMALEALQTDLSSPKMQQGQIFIVFWDSTHFDYSWPKDLSPKFTPFAKEFAYFKTFQSKHNIELIKNRYRNAVHYIDSLFGRFLENLPNAKKAIVMISGDHGEEFFEHGHLFHGSHLTHEQIHIPLYMRFGLSPKQKPTQHHLVSQMDLFPSVIDYLTQKAPQFLEGQSIFRERSWPFAISARVNASRAPYQFCLNNGHNKLIAQFAETNNIFASKKLRILSLCSAKDQSLPACKHGTQEWIEKEFGSGIEHLFKTEK